MQFSISISNRASLKINEGSMNEFDHLKHRWMNQWHFRNEELILFIEEYSNGPFTFRVIIMQLIKQLQIIWKDHVAGLKVTWIINGSRWDRDKQNVRVITSGEILGASEPGEYKLIDFICDEGKMKNYEEIFPGIKQQLELQISQRQKMSSSVAAILYHIDKNPYDGLVRDSFIEHKLEEMMLVLLHECSSDLNKYNNKVIDKREEEAAEKAERLIMQDISMHYTIRDLSRLVGLNQVRLKAVFKEIYGEGMFERLLHARMQHAHELIMGTDKPMKEIASLTGYSFLTSFINAFREYYQYTPGSLRRR